MSRIYNDYESDDDYSDNDDLDLFIIEEKKFRQSILKSARKTNDFKFFITRWEAYLNTEYDFNETNKLLNTMWLMINRVSKDLKREVRKRNKRIKAFSKWQNNMYDVHNEILYSPDLPFYKNYISDQTKRFFNF